MLSKFFRINVENHLSLVLNYVNNTSDELELLVPLTTVTRKNVQKDGSHRKTLYHNIKTHGKAGAKNRQFPVIGGFIKRVLEDYVFQLAFGLNGCDFYNRPIAKAIYFNIDDNGFTKIGQSHRPVFELQLYHQRQTLKPNVRNWSLPVDRPVKITIATGDVAQPTHILGSFTFDPEKIITRTVKKQKPKPTIICWGTKPTPRKLQYINRKICIPGDNIAMIRAAKVRFGKTPKDLSKIIDIDFSAAKYLNENCAYSRNKNCGPFVFEIPEGWNNVYSQIIMKDGTKSFPVRHIVN